MFMQNLCVHVSGSFIHYHPQTRNNSVALRLCVQKHTVGPPYKIWICATRGQSQIHYIKWIRQTQRWHPVYFAFSKMWYKFPKLYNSIYITFWKRQNYREEGRISASKSGGCGSEGQEDRGLQKSCKVVFQGDGAIPNVSCGGASMTL